MNNELTFIEDILCPDHLVLKWCFQEMVFKTVISDADLDCFEVTFLAESGYRINTEAYSWVMIDDLFQYIEQLNELDQLAFTLYDIFFNEDDDIIIESFTDYINGEGYIIKQPKSIN
jgi:hypothetical protein